MRSDVQHIRRSQFVFTYGPGAIIESKNGSRIIPFLNHGLGELFSEEKLRNFEISDSRLRIAIGHLKNGRARIFSLPTNASIGTPNSFGIYCTYIFPAWNICYGRIGKHSPILYYEIKCPICNISDDSTAVRFVTACIAGHLDEVPWNNAVHYKKRDTCNPKYFYWKTGGSSLSNIIIECPDCGLKTDMGQVYGIDFNCTGRFPEMEIASSKKSDGVFYTKAKRPHKYNCNEKMKVLQRQSSSLHIPETLTLLTIPEYDNEISNILQRTIVSSTINTIINSPVSPCDGKMGLEDLIKWIKNSLNKVISDESIIIIEDFLRNRGIIEFCEIFKNLSNENKTFIDFIFEEFESLLAGPRTTKNFSMSPPRTLSYKTDNIIPNLDIFPIKKIKTMTVQMSYKRIPYIGEPTHEPTPVPIGVFLDDHYWYPGFEGIGEGLFLTFAKNAKFDISKTKAFNEWENSHLKSNPTLWENIPQKPLFVWLHTLSHSIIKALSIFAGYSSASLRERVYISRKADNGGILIYTTSPGEDGSMGGLVGVVNNFNEIIDKAIENITYCSNDPLCSVVRKTTDRINGAACHSCLLISETSCEHRNRNLDLHIVRRD